MPEPSAPQRHPTVVTIVCWGLILTVVALTMFANHLKERRRERVPTTRAATVDNGPPGFELIIAGRTAVAAARGPSTNDAVRTQLVETLDKLALRPIDKLAVATVAYEVSGSAAALKRVEAVNDPSTKADAEALAAIYRRGADATLTEQRRTALAHDLSYFGRLAITQADPAHSADRPLLLAEARRTSIAATTAVATVTAAFFFGLIGLITVVVLFCVGTLRFAYVPPTTDRTVWLETFAVWIVSFVLLGIAGSLLPAHWPLFVGEALGAGLTVIVAVAWPMWRAKLSFAEVTRTLGWHRGRGVLVEVLCGIGGYLVGLPVVGVGLVVALLLSKVAGASPSHPITQEFGEGMSKGHILALLTAAAVLAPLLEETMFRGSLYGHLRRRHRPWLSAVVVALIFAAIHPQGWTAIPLLGSIALVLAFLREWRSSLIASMTAHAINNGFVVAIVALLLA